MRTLLDVHRTWAYVAIVANGLAGLYALAAWRRPSLRGKVMWWIVFVAQSLMMVQVLMGVILQSSKDYVAPRFHMFYGFIAFVVVGLAYSYRQQMRGRREVLYGFTGLFLMGLGIRAIMQST